MATAAALSPRASLGESCLKVPQIRVQLDGCSSSKRRRHKVAQGRTKKSVAMATSAEGHHQSDLASSLCLAASLVQDMNACGGAQESLATSTMERAIIGTSYNSEDDSESLFDSEFDSDSSDEDEPKSQVDMLIEKGTMLYIEEVNSALSSEGESDSSDYDSDSDITDVSPIVSATASPLGLSPVLQRRPIPTSPLVLSHNKHHHLQLDNSAHRPRPESPCFLPRPMCDVRGTTNMDILMKAVVEIEKSNKNINNNSKSDNDDVFIDPIRSNPHHRHLRRNSHRKNMSFSNEDVRNIDRTNKILLKKIMAVHTRTKSNLHSNHCEQSLPAIKSFHKQKEDERIRRTNLIMLRKIQAARPSPDILVRRTLSGPTVASST